MGRGRPGGNPDLKDHQFQSKHDEPCTAQVNIRVSPSLKAKLAKVPGAQDKIRAAMEAIAEEPIAE
jgi:hypothetical protein